MPRMEVYLPDALKAEMDECPSVNWSAIAQDAFKRAIATERSRNMDADAIAERVRGTMGKNSPKFIAGFEAGQEFAAQYADADDFEMLFALDFKGILDEEATAQDAATRIADSFGREVEWLFNDPSPTRNVILGFEEGALDVYAAIRDKLKV